MSKDLEAYIVELRHRLPNTYLRIFTNGLLIPKLSAALLNCIHDNKVEIFVSEYKPTYHMIDRLCSILDENRIRYILSGYDERSRFNLSISTKDKSIYPHKCISTGCYALGDGKLAKCPTLLYVYKFNEYFNEKLPTDGIIDLNENNMGGTDILNLLKQEVPLCKYCIEYPIEWNTCGMKKNKEDFCVEE